MKEYFLQLLFLCLFSNFALAQNHQSSDSSVINDPQISEQNYKHPNKAEAAKKSGKDQHIETSVVQVEDNSNYKQTFNQGTVNRTEVATPSPSANRKKNKNNYKNQFK